jgi:ABC-type transport system substrate-binding protein
VRSAEHLPFIPIYFPNTVWAHHKQVHGWRPTPTNLYPFYADVWLEE